MSKTYEKNWALRMVNICYKQFAGWVTDLRNRYGKDIFVRTEVNIILLQMMFAVTLSIVVAISFSYLYKDILHTLILGITQTIQTHGVLSAQTIIDSIQIVRAKNFITFLLISLSVAAIFSYVIAKITLTPVRQTLRSQKRFISDVAHELRTPLAIIKTNCEVALLDDDIEPTARKIFESNIEELDRTSSIINNLLSFNNLINPERIAFENVDMATTIEKVIRRLEKLAKSKQVKMHLEKRAFMTVWGNEAALDQIATNLIKNAINYSPAERRITVSIEPDDQGNVLLTVADNGVGIAPKDLRHIFEPFFRAEASRNRALGSSGLGLTIVSELVKLHNGKISVKSRLGKGTTVEVSLPYSERNLAEE